MQRHVESKVETRAKNGAAPTGKWVCTQLRVELIAGLSGQSLGEPLCDLNGHAPHGIRYMRI